MAIIKATELEPGMGLRLTSGTSDRYVEVYEVDVEPTRVRVAHEGGSRFIRATDDVEVWGVRS